jgi:hypothetical protein
MSSPPAGNSRPDSSPPTGKFPSGGEQQFPMDKIVLALGEYAVQLWKSAGLPHAKNATNFLKQSPAPTGQSRPGGNNGEKMGCLERGSNGRPGWRGTRPQAHRRQLSMSARSPRARRISYRECSARGARRLAIAETSAPRFTSWICGGLSRTRILRTGPAFENVKM